MARRRKTKDARDRERADADRHAWEQFHPRLAALTTYDEARLLVSETPPPDSPGRRYYSNLGFFLSGSMVPPLGSSYAEKALYLQFIQRLDAAGALKPGARQKVQEALRRAMDAQGSR
jgi:hypothetical protein